MKKFLIVTAIVILILAGGLYIGYHVLAPKVFDYIVEHNIKMIEDELIAKSNDLENTPDDSTETTLLDMFLGGLATNEESTGEDNAQSGNPAAPKEKKSLNDFSNAELLAVLQKMSSSDKTRIITILKDSVPSSELPKFLAMAQQGLTADNKKFAESHFQNNLSSSAKNEILKIVLKYIE